MVKTLIKCFFLLRRIKVEKNISGFTLLELLIALIMASIIVSTLLTFLVGVLDTDRKEQAKSESQEEIQAALNYIANDLQEAIYIYDADGLYLPSALTAPPAPAPPLQQRVIDQIPTASDRTPVLMFWKRTHYLAKDDIKTSSGVIKSVGCLDYPDNAATCKEGGVITGTPKGPDKYVFSLVVYYLMKGGTGTWSNTSRIGRWEIKDGIRWSCVDQSNAAQTDGSKCPVTDKGLRTITPNDVPTSGTFYNVDPNIYVVLPDQLFLRFDVSGTGTLSDRMNRWRLGGSPLSLANTTPTVLVDYIDDTLYAPVQDGVGVSPIKIGIEKNTAAGGTVLPLTAGNQSKNRDCDKADVGVGVGLDDASLGTAAQTNFSQRLPVDFALTTNEYNPTRLSSFYACVNARNVVARVFLRGNSLARLEPNPNFRVITDDKRASFIPTASVRAFGRGTLSLD